MMSFNPHVALATGAARCSADLPWHLLPGRWLVRRQQGGGRFLIVNDSDFQHDYEATA
jgi:hypothetical protein